MRRRIGWIMVMMLVGCMGACAHKGVQPVRDEDNPAHHYLMGMELIDKNNLTEASARFDRAIALDPKYAPAMAGKALVSAIKAGAEKDKEHQSVELERALDTLDKAMDKADGDSQEFDVYVTGIRVYTWGRPKNWIDKAEKYYKKALRLSKVKAEELPYYKTKESAHYFMGMAFYKDYKFREAEGALALVLGATPGPWHEPADKLYRKVQKITRASTNYTITDVAKKIAIKDEVIRADVAALLVDEIQLDRFFAGRIPEPQKPSKESFIPADIQKDPFKEEILLVLKWNLRGLEPIYDNTSKAYLFYPDKPIARKELAFVLEDLLIKVTADQALATKFFGQKNSPYPDVPPTASWFNAVMNVVSRGLMEADLSAAFRPESNTDGAELLLGVLRLRNVMNVK